MDKPLPDLTTDEEVEAFLDPEKDLSEFITSENFRPVPPEKPEPLRS